MPMEEENYSFQSIQAYLSIDYLRKRTTDFSVPMRLESKTFFPSAFISSRLRKVATERRGVSAEVPASRR